MAKDKREAFYLDGETLEPETAFVLARNPDKYKILLSDEAWDRIDRSREVIDNILESGVVKYGINTGFGMFATVVIEGKDLEKLQVNLIESHAAGVGQPLTIHKTRMLMILRINVLAKGHSGVSRATLQKYLNALNNNCLPMVPEKGTVGASGDLAPLAHLALGLLGKGEMWNPKTESFEPADKVLKENQLEPIQLGAKEGLALINGTQLICAFGVEALVRATRLLEAANVVVAITLEALMGTRVAYREDIHNARPHTGQKWVALQLRKLFDPDRYDSSIYLSHINCPKVQDAYTLRCVPQVHGIVYDTLEFVRRILTTEINSATDNPMVFPETREVVSGGNFHGEYPAKVLDYLAIGIQEVANMSERRIERLCNHHLSELPAFLVERGGLNSGFMIAHCTAAALTSENKTLCHPASCDTISTSAAKEDHVSMGGWAARKALQVVENVETVVAIELLCAVQGLEFHRPLKTTEPLEAVVAEFRKVVAPWEEDRYMKPSIDAALEFIRSGRLHETIGPFLRN